MLNKLSLKHGLLMLGLAGGMLLSACAPVQLDPNSAQAQAGAPAAAEVEELNLQYNPNLPRYVVVVGDFYNAAQGSNTTSGAAGYAAYEPYAEWKVSILRDHFRVPVPSGGRRGGPGGGGPGGQGGPGGGGRRDDGVKMKTMERRIDQVEGQSGLASGGTVELNSQAGPADQIGQAIAAQCKTALSHWPNIVLLGIDSLKYDEQNDCFTCQLNPGEIGPFIVCGTLTEYNETSEQNQQNNSLSLGGVGAVMAAAGVRGGSELAAINPEFKNKAMTSKGMVGMDIQIVDARTNRYNSVSAKGTFVTQTRSQGWSVAGSGQGSSATADSALGQATRAAMNQALEKTANVLAAYRQ